MDYIKEQITEWLKEILTDGIISNLSGLFDNPTQQVVNEEVSFAASNNATGSLNDVQKKKN